MIKHIVMWDITENFEGRNKPELISELKRQLEALKNSIGEIKELEVGINLSGSDASCDVVLYSEFESLDDLEKYRVHPEHVKIAGFVGKITTSRHVVDYEV